MLLIHSYLLPIHLYLSLICSYTLLIYHTCCQSVKWHPLPTHIAICWCPCHLALAQILQQLLNVGATIAMTMGMAVIVYNLRDNQHCLKVRFFLWCRADQAPTLCYMPWPTQAYCHHIHSKMHLKQYIPNLCYTIQQAIMPLQGGVHHMFWVAMQAWLLRQKCKLQPPHLFRMHIDNAQSIHLLLSREGLSHARSTRLTLGTNFSVLMNCCQNMNVSLTVSALGLLSTSHPFNAHKAPLNKSSICTFHHQFYEIIFAKIRKEHYIDPMSNTKVVQLIGPFQLSPFSITEKLAKPGKYRIIQNFSFLISHLFLHSNTSINSYVISNKFTCTYGTFMVVCTIIATLPLRSEMAVWDVWGISHNSSPPLQWTAAVVHMDDTSFCIDTCAAFRAWPSGGIYGIIANAAAEIFRSQGISPLVKWVDNKSLFRILCQYLAAYNEGHAKQSAHTIVQGRVHQLGRHLWYSGNTQPDRPVLEMTEDCAFLLPDLSEDLTMMLCSQTVSVMLTKFLTNWTFHRNIWRMCLLN